MEERTIGGIPVKEVFEKLRGDIPNVIRYMDDNEGNPYLESNVMRRHFDACVPLQNYEFSITEPEFVVHGDRACFTCIGTLTVYDDAGKKVVSKSFFGGNNCIIINSSGQAKDLALDAKNAAVTVRKECIRMYGCGERQLSEAKEQHKQKKAGTRGGFKRQAETKAQPVSQNTGNLAATNSTSSALPQGKEQGEKPVENSIQPTLGSSSFLLAYESGKEIRENSRMILFPVLCREYRNYRTNLLVWKNKVRSIDDLKNRICTGIEFECKGKFEKYGNEFRIVYERIEV